MIGMDVKGARWEVKVAGREWNGQKREEFGRGKRESCRLPKQQAGSAYDFAFYST